MTPNRVIQRHAGVVVWSLMAAVVVLFWVAVLVALVLVGDWDSLG